MSADAGWRRLIPVRDLVGRRLSLTVGIGLGIDRSCRISRLAILVDVVVVVALRKRIGGEGGEGIKSMFNLKEILRLKFETGVFGTVVYVM